MHPRTLIPASRLARQLAVLGLVLCAVALSVAFPLRTYFEQRADLDAAVAAQQALQQERDELAARRAALQDPDYLAAEARRRLQYVTPGDTVFVVHAPQPETHETAPATPDRSHLPWYGDLWATLTDAGPS